MTKLECKFIGLKCTMGHEQSLPKARRTSLRSFSIKTMKRSKRNSQPSFTFRMCETIGQMYQLNINSANEEELMTLPGITRELAKNIIEHRKIIGRFKKVEDLALVTGIGATKMQELQPEISVSNRRLHSQTSSRVPSYDSINSHESKATSKSNKLLNINKATIFDLQTIDGISQEMAAALVHYRLKHGHFKKLGELLKVKGINKMVLNHICDYLTVVNTENTVKNEVRPNILTSCHTIPYFTKTSSACNNLCITNNHNLPDDVFELLSIYSPRPPFQRFDFKNGETLAVRIGSWNLSAFSFEKASNMGVKEVIGRTILENGLSILALQDVHVAALKTICDELNNPHLQKIRDWNSERYWNFCMLDKATSKLGFIYDSQGVFDIKLTDLYEGPNETTNVCEAVIASFVIDNLELQLANLLIKNNSKLDMLYGKIKELTSPDDMSLVFIDLSETEEIQLPNNHLKSLILPNNSVETGHRKSKTQNVSNILFNSKVDIQRTGASGIIKQGLTHLAIPNGWSWGGSVSQYNPIWIELFVNPITVTSL